MYTIAITHPAGGVGKTTTALNLGYELAAAGHSVLLVDLDPQADLSRRLGLLPAVPTLADAMIGADTRPAFSRKAWADVSLDVLPGNLEIMGGLDLALAGQQQREQRLRRALAPFQTEYDFCLLDCPPNLTLLGINALYTAQAVLVPVQAQDKAVAQLATVNGNLKEVQGWRAGMEASARPLPALLGYVLTMVEPGTNQSRLAVEDMRAEYDGLVFDAMIPKRTALQNDSRWEAPIHVYEPGNAATVAYAVLAQEVIRRVEIT